MVIYDLNSKIIKMEWNSKLNIVQSLHRAIATSCNQSMYVPHLAYEESRMDNFRNLTGNFFYCILSVK